MAARRGPEDWTPEVAGRFWAYLATRSGGQSYFSDVYGDALRRLLAATGRLRGRVLDLGCGPGFLVRRLLEEGVTCYGVDASAEAVRASNDRCARLPNWRGALTAGKAGLPYRSRAFDVVCCVETLEHLGDSDLERVLAEIRRVLVPSGLALFTTPDSEDLANAFQYCPFCDSEFHPVQHVRSFTSEGLATRLANSGYEVLFSRGIDLKAAGAGISRLGLRGGLRRAALISLGWFRPLPLSSSYAFRALLSPGPNLLALARCRE